MRNLIDVDRLRDEMYSEAFEQDTDMQKWDSGCWIRYKLFEQVIERQSTVNEWIPVSKRLPEEGEEVFAVIGNEEQYEIDKATYISGCVWFKDMLKFDPNEEVLAWMPIPTYKGE